MSEGTTADVPVRGIVYPPTLREVMLRPQWLGMLVLALVVAGIFAWLGQWQLSRAVDTDPTPAGATEEVRPLADVSAPGETLPEPLVGQRVSVTGQWVAGDFLVVSSRFNDGAEGFWVTGHLRVDTDDDSDVALAVAIGWTASAEDAEAVAAALNEASPTALDLVGRLVSDEGAAAPPTGADPYELVRMSPAMLLGQWQDPTGLQVYRSYLVLQSGVEPLPDGLCAISSPAPEELGAVNWLNIFYAAEWVIFAGFAFYMWYRLARDAWEREVEDLTDDDGDDDDPGADGGADAGDDEDGAVRLTS